MWFEDIVAIQHEERVFQQVLCCLQSVGHAQGLFLHCVAYLYAETPTITEVLTVGREEIEILEPAIEEARAEGINALGPFPADTLFGRAVNGQFDLVVAMYHDQGLIPVKLAGFGKGVNVTIGLPFVRTSPDHGTAFGKAWEWRANPDSMISAIKLASQMARGAMQNDGQES